MKYIDDVDELIDRLDDLKAIQKDIIKWRYRFLMAEYRRRCRIYSMLFYILRITMTVGSLAVPALLSIQSSNTAAMYWFTWSLSLAVTTANGILTLFKLDKRFFTLHATAERLRTETYQFIMLSGRYSGHHGHHGLKPTHASQYVYYCSQLEKIHMKQIDEEFIKNADMDGAQHPPTAALVQQRISDAAVPSPADQAALISLPLQIQRARSESQDSVGSHESPPSTTNSEENKDTLSLRREKQSAMSKPSDARISILSAAPEMSSESAIRIGTTLPARPVQSGSPSARDT